MKTWNEISRLVYKILYEKYHDYDLELLGEAYIAYTTACESYDPLKSSFNTHLAWVIRGHMSNLHRYSGLVAIPVLKQEECKHSYLGFDTPMGDDGITFADILLDKEPEPSEEALVAFLLDECASLYPNVASGLQKAIKALVAEIKHGDVPPRKLRTEMCNLRKILLDRYKKKYVSN